MKGHTPLFSLKWRLLATIGLILSISYYHDIKKLKHRIQDIEDSNICGSSNDSDKNQSVLMEYTKDSDQKSESDQSSKNEIKNLSENNNKPFTKTYIHQPQYEPYLRKKENKAIALGKSVEEMDAEVKKEQTVDVTKISSRSSGDINQECRNL